MCANATQRACWAEKSHNVRMDDHSRASALPPGGFVPLPRPLFDALLCDQDALGFGVREVLLLLLIARLTYGCRSGAWAALPPAALAAVGIGRGHAREHLRRLLASGLMERNEESDEYRLCPALPEGMAIDPERKEMLGALVGAHLALTRRARPAEHSPAPLPSAASAPAAKAFLEHAQRSSFPPARTLPAAAVNYADPGGYGGNAGRHWHYDKAGQRWWRDPDTARPASAPPDLRQAAVDVFAPDVPVPRSAPPVKATAR